MEFQLWNLDVDIRNAPLASGDRADSRFEADSSIMLEVPVSFGGKISAKYEDENKDKCRLYS